MGGLRRRTPGGLPPEVGVVSADPVFAGRREEVERDDVADGFHTMRFHRRDGQALPSDGLERRDIERVNAQRQAEQAIDQARGDDR